MNRDQNDMKGRREKRFETFRLNNQYDKRQECIYEENYMNQKLDYCFM